MDDGPLKDIADILTLKPELTDEEQTVADKLRPQLKAVVRTEVRAELEVEYAKKAKLFQDELTVASREAVQTAIKGWREEQEPLSNDDIKTLLSQDYINFEVKFKTRKGKIADFNLVELPQAVEERFLKILKKRFIPMIKNLAASEMKLDLNGDTMDKLQSIVEALPDTLNVLAEVVAVCLDPFEEYTATHGEINELWVKENLSTNRILAVIIGQMEVQRYRDFFLNGFRLSKSLKQTR